jgi:hypothetical protein
MGKNQFIEQATKNLIKESIVGGECVDIGSYLPLYRVLEILEASYNQGIKDCEVKLQAKQ